MVGERQNPYDANILFDLTLDSQDPRTLKAVGLLLILLGIHNGYRNNDDIYNRHRKRHFRYFLPIVENLIVAHRRGEEYWMSYHRDKRYYSRNRTNKRTNPKGLHHLLVRYIDALIKHGFIQNEPGFDDPGDPHKSVLPRMRPSKRFIEELIIPLWLR